MVNRGNDTSLFVSHMVMCEDIFRYSIKKYLDISSIKNLRQTCLAVAHLVGPLDRLPFEIWKKTAKIVANGFNRRRPSNRTVITVSNGTPLNDEPINRAACFSSLTDILEKINVTVDRTMKRLFQRQSHGNYTTFDTYHMNAFHGSGNNLYTSERVSVNEPIKELMRDTRIMKEFIPLSKKISVTIKDILQISGYNTDILKHSSNNERRSHRPKRVNQKEDRVLKDLFDVVIEEIIFCEVIPGCMNFIEMTERLSYKHILYKHPMFTVHENGYSNRFSSDSWISKGLKVLDLKDFPDMLTDGDLVFMPPLLSHLSASIKITKSSRPLSVLSSYQQGASTKLRCIYKVHGINIFKNLPSAKNGSLRSLDVTLIFPHPYMDNVNNFGIYKLWVPDSLTGVSLSWGFRGCKCQYKPKYMKPINANHIYRPYDHAADTWDVMNYRKHTEDARYYLYKKQHLILSWISDMDDSISDIKAAVESNKDTSNIYKDSTLDFYPLMFVLVTTKRSFVEDETVPLPLSLKDVGETTIPKIVAIEKEHIKGEYILYNNISKKSSQWVIDDTSSSIPLLTSREKFFPLLNLTKLDICFDKWGMFERLRDLPNLSSLRIRSFPLSESVEENFTQAINAFRMIEKFTIKLVTLDVSYPYEIIRVSKKGENFRTRIVDAFGGINSYGTLTEGFISNIPRSVLHLTLRESNIYHNHMPLMPPKLLSLTLMFDVYPHCSSNCHYFNNGLSLKPWRSDLVLSKLPITVETVSLYGYMSFSRLDRLYLPENLKILNLMFTGRGCINLHDLYFGGQIPSSLTCLNISPSVKVTELSGRVKSSLKIPSFQLSRYSHSLVMN